MKKLKWLSVLGILGGLAFGAISEPDKALFPPRQLLTNGGWENGTTGWAASGGTYARSTSSPGAGNAMGTWDSGSAAQTLTSTAVAIPAGALGKNGVASCAIKCATGTCTHTLNAYDGTNILASQTITSSTASFLRTSVNFDFPTSGNIQLRISSVASDEPSISIDECFLGIAEGINVAKVGQANLIGRAYYAGTSNCIWDRTSATVGAFGTDTDCPAPTVDLSELITISTADNNLPQITATNIPAGKYEITATLSGTDSAGGSNNTWAISDGTTTSGNVGTKTESTSHVQEAVVIGIFSYTTAQSSVTWAIHAASDGATTVSIVNNAAPRRLTFTVKRFPLASETAVSFDKAVASWSGFHSDNCNFTRTNTSFGDFAADSTCTFTQVTNTNFGTVASQLSGADPLPGITFTPPVTGTYEVCAFTNSNGATAGQNYSLQLTDSVVANPPRLGWDQDTNGYTRPLPLCFYPVATSITPMTVKLQGRGSSGAIGITPPSSGAGYAINWTIKLLSSSFTGITFSNMPATPATSTERIARAVINCDASSAITSQSGSWVSSVGNISSGACVITLFSGTFSAAPTCVSTDNDTTGTGLFTSISAASSTSITIDGTTDAGGAPSTVNASIICMGPR